MKKELQKIKNDNDINFIIETAQKFADLKRLSKLESSLINSPMESLAEQGEILNLFDKAFNKIVENYTSISKLPQNQSVSAANKKKQGQQLLINNKNLVTFLNKVASDKNITISQMLDSRLASALLAKEAILVSMEINNSIFNDFISVFSSSSKKDKTSFLINYLRSKKNNNYTVFSFFENIKTPFYSENFVIPSTFLSEMVSLDALTRLDSGFEFTEQDLNEAISFMERNNFNLSKELPKYLDARLPKFVDYRETLPGTNFLDTMLILEPEEYIENFNLILENMNSSAALFTHTLKRAKDNNLSLSQNIKDRLYSVIVNDISSLFDLIGYCFSRNYYSSSSFKINEFSKSFESLRTFCSTLEDMKKEHKLSSLKTALVQEFKGSVVFSNVQKVLFAELKNSYYEVQGDRDEKEYLNTVSKLETLEQKLNLASALESKDKKNKKDSKNQLPIKVIKVHKI